MLFLNATVHFLALLSFLPVMIVSVDVEKYVGAKCNFYADNVCDTIGIELKYAMRLVHGMTSRNGDEDNSFAYAEDNYLRGTMFEVFPATATARVQDVFRFPGVNLSPEGDLLDGRGAEYAAPDFRQWQGVWRDDDDVTITLSCFSQYGEVLKSHSRRLVPTGSWYTVMEWVTGRQGDCIAACKVWANDDAGFDYDRWGPATCSS